MRWLVLVAYTAVFFGLGFMGALVLPLVGPFIIALAIVVAHDYWEEAKWGRLTASFLPFIIGVTLVEFLTRPTESVRHILLDLGMLSLFYWTYALIAVFIELESPKGKTAT